MKKLTQSELLVKFKKVHADKYDYSDLWGINSNSSKVTIVCRHHGSFEQQYRKHIEGQGCPTCSQRDKGLSQRHSTKEFINKSKKIYGNCLFLYENTKYTTARESVIVTCRIHGDFNVIASNHLRFAKGCPLCSKSLVRGNTVIKFPEFMRRISDKQRFRYSYYASSYVACSIPTRIYCKRCCSDFFQRPSFHLKGQNCPNCANWGFNNLAPAIVYYVKIESDELDKPLYKIGITNTSLINRFSKTEYSIMTVLKIWKFEKGADAREKELRILNKHCKYSYKGCGILRSGNTEIFTEDVLRLDNGI